MATFETVTKEAEKHIQQFKQALLDLPNMEGVSAFAHAESPRNLVKLFIQYRGVVKRLVSLSDEELLAITEINTRFEKEGANTFLAQLTPEQKNQLVEIITEASDTNFPDYQDALTDLQRMMNRANELKNRGEILRIKIQNLTMQYMDICSSLIRARKSIF